MVWWLLKYPKVSFINPCIGSSWFYQQAHYSAHSMNIPECTTDWIFHPHRISSAEQEDTVMLLKHGDSRKMNVNQHFAWVQPEPDCTSSPPVVPGSLMRVQAKSVPQYRIFFTRVVQNLQSYDLFWLDALLKGHPGQKKKKGCSTCSRTGHLMNLN